MLNAAVNQPGQVRGQECFPEIIINTGRRGKKNKSRLGCADRKKNGSKVLPPPVYKQTVGCRA